MTEFCFAKHTIFLVVVFPKLWDKSYIFLCGDNSTEYSYEVFMLEKLVFMEKSENWYSYLHL